MLSIIDPDTAQILWKKNKIIFIYIYIRVRGFPLRDILSLRALGDVLGQARKIVGTSSPPSASFSQVLGLVKKITQNCGFVKNSSSGNYLVKDNSLLYIEFSCM